MQTYLSLSYNGYASIDDDFSPQQQPQQQPEKTSILLKNEASSSAPDRELGYTTDDYATVNKTNRKL